ncbi:hypothetical protein DAPPUDRAFT_256902 [Daphnia pulex]|uniref:Uncharacterized protein n=1 Tax=Daphnia pulex TaxID=6669 RepID=E9HCD1_DAPPU|nr:hypothetical protein DAPPUDRAFT_256902 [Daphnia pulex]|eukprot:EFX70602.1 hypothetical protein DAPPUDRAFT_256902 [Daphnia pulex]
MAGSTTGVPISPRDGGHEKSVATGYYTGAPKYYTTKGPEYYTTTCTAPMLLRRSSEVFFFPEFHYLHHAVNVITLNNVNTYLPYEGLQYYATMAPE